MINKKEVLNFFNKEKFLPSKKFGQNFLIDVNIIKKLNDLILLEMRPNVILEIGPGFGSITELLIQNKNIFYKGIELDKRLVNFLINKQIVTCDEIICNDALKVNWNNLFLEHNNICLVGNLPYSISTQLIAKFIDSNKFNSAILMLQLEMANRICAKINSTNYNGTSVYIQSYVEVIKKFIVEPNCFIPKPKIKSCVVVLKKLNNIYDIDMLSFRKFLNLCFNQRRKTLFNNLKTRFSKDKIVNSLNKLNKNINIRPQCLSPNEYIKLMEYCNE